MLLQSILQITDGVLVPEGTFPPAAAPPVASSTPVQTTARTPPAVTPAPTGGADIFSALQSQPQLTSMVAAVQKAGLQCKHLTFINEITLTFMIMTLLPCVRIVIICSICSSEGKLLVLFSSLLWPSMIVEIAMRGHWNVWHCQLTNLVHNWARFGMILAFQCANYFAGSDLKDEWPLSSASEL